MKGLDSTQIEQLKEIAEYLYQQRQHQGVSLEKIATQTYIPQRILQALESAQLDILPEPVYIKGFIRRYADTLGLDGIMIADAFDVEPASLNHAAPEVQPEITAPTPRLAPPLAESQPEPRAERQLDRNPRPERSPQPGLSFLPWIGAGIAALALGAFAFSLLNQPKQSAVVNPTERRVPTPQSPGSSSTQKSSSPDVSLSAVPPAKNSTAGSPIQVDLNLTDRSWLEVSVDGKVEYEGSLDKGEQRTWKAKKSILIVAGNAGAVLASFNQGEAKALGKSGSVATVSFPTQKELP